MWAAIRIIRLCVKSLSRIAAALESLRDLYELDLESRGIIRADARLTDQVEVSYGFTEPERDV